MYDASIYCLIFDITDGPSIAGKIGGIFLTEEEENSLKRCAFPDCVMDSFSDSLIFVFRINNWYCYCMYMTAEDPTAPRGHSQSSFVIVTSLPYAYIFTRLLQSSRVMGVIPPSDMLEIFQDFYTKDMALLPKKSGEKSELPVFDGSIPVMLSSDFDAQLSSVGGIGWNPSCKLYYLNDSFLDFDVIGSLLLDRDSSYEVLLFWEAVILEESILVYAPTPIASSSAVLSIASLVFPEPVSEKIDPFISVTDLRFQDIFQNPHGHITGVSNPIALQYASKFEHIINISQKTSECNVQNNKQNKPQIDLSSNSSLRHDLYYNTCKILQATTQALSAIQKINPYASYSGQITPEFLAEYIAMQKPQLISTPINFAKKLLRSKLFSRVWQSGHGDDHLYDALQGFSLDSICADRSEHELIDLYSLISNVRKQCSSNPKLLKRINQDIETLTLYLSPDLVLAPLS